MSEYQQALDALTKELKENTEVSQKRDEELQCLKARLDAQPDEMFVQIREFLAAETQRPQGSTTPGSPAHESVAPIFPQIALPKESSNRLKEPVLSHRYGSRARRVSNASLSLRHELGMQSPKMGPDQPPFALDKTAQVKKIYLKRPYNVSVNTQNASMDEKLTERDDLNASILSPKQQSVKYLSQLH